MSAFPYRDDWAGVIQSTVPFTVTYTQEPGLDVELAIRLLHQRARDCIPFGARTLKRAAQHLEDRLEQDLFGPTIRLQELGQAQALLKSLGHDLQQAAQTLQEAAEQLKAAGKVMPANRAYQAHLRLRDRAQELLG